MKTVLAILMLDHGEPRMCCVGCTERLAGLGMVRAIGQRPINRVDTEHVATTYEIAAPFNLENCRAAIRDRHVGPPWGS